jgi:hypothetical protein
MKKGQSSTNSWLQRTFLVQNQNVLAIWCLTGNRFCRLGKSAALPNIQNIGVKNHDVGLRKLSPTYGVSGFPVRHYLPKSYQIPRQTCSIFELDHMKACINPLPKKAPLSALLTS